MNHATSIVIGNDCAVQYNDSRRRYFAFGSLLQRMTTVETQPAKVGATHLRLDCAKNKALHDELEKVLVRLIDWHTGLSAESRNFLICLKIGWSDLLF